MQKVVFITGASSGIGEACAKLLVKHGYRVYGTSRKYFSDRSYNMVQIDVTKSDSVEWAIKTVIEKEGRIDVLINNAGFGLAGAVEDTSITEAKAQFETNFFGLLRVTKEVLPHMRRRRKGLIINISSIGGLIGLPFQALYSASKFAVEGLSEGLRLELRPYNINVVLIEPGDARTKFTKNRILSRKAKREESPYWDPFHYALKAIEKSENEGASPSKVAKKVLWVMRAKKPVLRYKVGSTFEIWGSKLKGMLPYSWFERIMDRYYYDDDDDDD